MNNQYDEFMEYKNGRIKVHNKENAKVVKKSFSDIYDTVHNIYHHNIEDYSYSTIKYAICREYDRAIDNISNKEIVNESLNHIYNIISSIDNDIIHYSVLLIYTVDTKKINNNMYSIDDKCKNINDFIKDLQELKIVADEVIGEILKQEDKAENLAQE